MGNPLELAVRIVCHPCRKYYSVDFLDFVLNAEQGYDKLNCPACGRRGQLAPPLPAPEKEYDDKEQP